MENARKRGGMRILRKEGGSFRQLGVRRPIFPLRFAQIFNPLRQRGGICPFHSAQKLWVIICRGLCAAIQRVMCIYTPFFRNPLVFPYPQFRLLVRITALPA